MNEYLDANCHDCGDCINSQGFCIHCGFDYEEWLRETEKDWGNNA